MFMRREGLKMLWKKKVCYWVMGLWTMGITVQSRRKLKGTKILGSSSRQKKKRGKKTNLTNNNNNNNNNNSKSGCVNSDDSDSDYNNDLDGYYIFDSNEAIMYNQTGIHGLRGF